MIDNYLLIQVLYINDVSAKIKVEQLIGNNITAKSILSSILVANIVTISLFFNFAPFYALIAVWVT